MHISKYVPAYAVPQLQNRLEGLSESEFVSLQALELRDPTMMLIISILGGTFGIDRFMLGQVGLGVAKLLMAGLCTIWTIVDLFLIMDEARKYNLEKINQALFYIGK